MRTEFGAERTSCDCTACASHCAVMPGYLIPSDLPRMAHGKDDFYAFVDASLEASPGAKVIDTRSGEIFNIPTLVPRARQNGSCMFFVEGRCTIHEVSPFGCAFFDNHIDPTKAERLKMESLHAIIRNGAKDGLYHRVWRRLVSQGKITKSPEAKRAQNHSYR